MFKFWSIIFFRAKETHQIAEATQEKNARLKEAFGLGEYYVDGSAFDPDRKSKEEAAKALAMAQKKYRLVNESQYNPCTENKGADQLNQAADLQLCFAYAKCRFSLFEPYRAW